MKQEKWWHLSKSDKIGILAIVVAVFLGRWAIKIEQENSERAKATREDEIHNSKLKLIANINKLRSAAFDMYNNSPGDDWSYWDKDTITEADNAKRDVYVNKIEAILQSEADNPFLQESRNIYLEWTNLMQLIKEYKKDIGWHYDAVKGGIADFPYTNGDIFKLFDNLRENQLKLSDEISMYSEINYDRISKGYEPCYGDTVIVNEQTIKWSVFYDQMASEPDYKKGRPHISISSFYSMPDYQNRLQNAKQHDKTK